MQWVSCTFWRSNLIVNVRVPMRSNNSQLLHTIESRHIVQEQVPLEEPWRSHSTAFCWDTALRSNNKRQEVTWTPQLHCLRTDREWFHAKAITPTTVAQASQLFSAKERPFTQKNCFVQIQTFKSDPWFSSPHTESTSTILNTCKLAYCSYYFLHSTLDTLPYSN